MHESSSRLVVVSYRGPVSLEADGGTTRFRRGEGGLVSALVPVMADQGGLWISSGELPAGVPPGGSFLLPGRKSIQVLHLPIPPPLHKRHYLGFSNRVLWPLAHGFPYLMRYDRAEARGYAKVNRLFSDAVIAHTRPGDVIWIQDYHFALLPAMIRERAPDRRTALFWHIPFPPPEILRVLPNREELLAGMLGADAVHFHLPEYAKAFREAIASREAPAGGAAESRKVAVGAHPIGIDTAAWIALREDPGTTEEALALRKAWAAPRIVLGVDRLDYTKGILQRILAFERLLEGEPSNRGAVTLVQVAVPSRTQVPEYRRMRREIEETVGRVNGRFSHGAYTPIRYFYRSLRRRTLAAFYRAADIGLVTPLRDGMNLIAMEFMMINADRAPVLVLSELAGASDVLPGAILVNPHDVDGVAEALQKAMEMDETERRTRAVDMVDAIRRLDVHAWAARILADVSGPGADEGGLSAARPERPVELPS